MEKILEFIPLLDTLMKTSEEYEWLINIENLRIPILSDLSKLNLIATNIYDSNLGDGTDTTLLASLITSDTLYHCTLSDLEKFIDGPYKHQYESYCFIFFPGIRRHEEHHFLMKKRFIPERLNNITFPSFRKWTHPITIYSCPEELTSIYPHLITHLKTDILVGGDLSIAKDKEIDLTGVTEITMKKDEGFITKKVKNCELKADEYASNFYREVKERIKQWWQNR